MSWGFRHPDLRETLRRARKERGLTYNALMRASGLNDAQVRGLLRGEKNSQRRTVERMMAALGVEVRYRDTQGGEVLPVVMHAMERRGWSETQTCGYARLEPGTLQGWIDGERLWTLFEMQRVLQALGVECGYVEKQR